MKMGYLTVSLLQNQIPAEKPNELSRIFLFISFLTNITADPKVVANQVKTPASSA